MARPTVGGSGTAQLPWTTRGGIGAMVMGRSGVLYLAGSFTKVGPRTGSGGVVRNGAAALDIRTGIATDWNPSPKPNPIRGLALSPSGRIVYAVGDFKRIGGTHRSRIAALDPRSGASLAWRPALLNREQDAVAVAPDEARVYIAGGSGVAALDAHTGKLLWRALRRGATAVAVSPDGATVFASGLIRRKLQSVYVLAALRARDGLVRWTRLTGCCSVDTLLISADGRTLYVGGQFEKIGAVVRHNLAAVDPATGRVKSWAPKPGGYVGLEEDEGIDALGLEPRSQVLYVGGSFETMGGKPHVALAAVDARSGRVLDWNPPTHGGIVCAVALSPRCHKALLRRRLLRLRRARSC